MTCEILVDSELFMKVTKLVEAGVSPSDVYGRLNAGGPIETRQVTDALGALCFARPELFPEGKDSSEYSRAFVTELEPKDKVAAYLSRLKTLPPMSVSVLKEDIARLYGTESDLLAEALLTVEGVEVLRKRGVRGVGLFIGARDRLGFDPIGKEIVGEVQVKETVRRKPSNAIRLTKPRAYVGGLRDKITNALRASPVPMSTAELSELLKSSPAVIHRVTLELKEAGTLRRLVKADSRSKYYTLINNAVPEGFGEDTLVSTRKAKQAPHHFVRGEAIIHETARARYYDTGVVLLRRKRYTILELEMVIADAKANGIVSLEIKGKKGAGK